MEIEIKLTNSQRKTLAAAISYVLDCVDRVRLEREEISQLETIQHHLYKKCPECGLLTDDDICWECLQGKEV